MSAAPPGREAWRLRPGDLPPPEIAGALPPLAGLENNVVYRSMLFGRRARSSLPRVESSIGVGVVLLGSALLLTCFGPLFFFVAFPLHRFFRRPEANVLAFFGMPETLLRELVDLRVPAPEWSAALWGRVVSAGHRRRQGYLTLLGIALCLAYTRMAEPWSMGLFGLTLHASLFLILGLRFGLILGSLFALPFAPLPGLVQRVRRFRNATALSNNPLAWIYALALILGMLLGALLLAGLIYGAAAAVLHVFPGVERLRRGAWFSPVAGFILPLGLGLAAGVVRVGLHAGRARRRAGEYLEELNGEVEGMLGILRARFDFGGDEQVRVPRLQFRPSGDAPGRLHNPGARPGTASAPGSVTLSVAGSGAPDCGPRPQAPAGSPPHEPRRGETIEGRASGEGPAT